MTGIIRCASTLVVLAALPAALLGGDVPRKNTIPQAIDLGIAHLKTLQAKDGSWKYERDNGQDAGQLFLHRASVALDLNPIQKSNQ